MVSLTLNGDIKPRVSSHTVALRNIVISFEEVQASLSVKGEATVFLGSLKMGNSIC